LIRQALGVDSEVGAGGLRVGLQAFSYGFAHGLMASRVAQFGERHWQRWRPAVFADTTTHQSTGCARVVRAADFRAGGGAPVRVTAHTFGLARITWGAH
jgi:hypothetical protein